MFVERASGKDTDRPQLQDLRTYAREGDTLVVHSMDRLARNVDDLRRLVQEFTRRGIVVEFRKEQLTFTGDDSPMSQLLLTLLGAVAQFERDLSVRGSQPQSVAESTADASVFLRRTGLPNWPPGRRPGSRRPRWPAKPA